MRVSRTLIHSFINNSTDTITEELFNGGFILQSSAGVFHLLPLGKIVVDKIIKIIKNEMDTVGCLEVGMPILQKKQLWERSGRADGYADESFWLEDRGGKKYILAPTSEEAAVEIAETFLKSYKNLPCHIYEITYKYRDDLRPRFGMIRCKEFIMKDNYSFDITVEDAHKSYILMYNTYIRIFKKMGLKPIPVQADTGLIGGKLSHEIVILADFGENDVFYNTEEYNEVSTLDEILSNCATFENNANHQAENKNKCIELGHIYYLGTKYSKTMGAEFTNQDNKLYPFEMGCYGIGVTRLLSAIKVIHKYWPKILSPYDIYLIGDNNTILEDIYKKLLTQYSVLFDDRDKTFNNKINQCTSIGIPIALIVGKTISIKFKDQIHNCDNIDQAYELINYLYSSSY